MELEGGWGMLPCPDQGDQWVGMEGVFGGHLWFFGCCQAGGNCAPGSGWVGRLPHPTVLPPRASSSFYGDTVPRMGGAEATVLPRMPWGSQPL